MGRTLHYKLSQANKFTKKQAKELFEISMRYNSGGIENAWTCENFFIDVYSYYPNWDMKDNSWEKINTMYDSLAKTGIHHVDIIEHLLKDGWVNLHEPIGNSVRGFTKTQGNEFNSAMVLSALLEISQAFPKAEITLSDEGMFLLCDLRIKKGKVLPNLTEMQENIQHWSSIAFFNTHTKSMNEIRKNILPNMDKDLVRTLNMDGSYKNYAEEHLKELLGRMNSLVHIIKENYPKSWIGNGLGGGDIQFNLYNLKNLSPDEWFNPALFHRYVDLEKFLDYKMSPATLMDGFNGEGFGLSEDSEGKSYQMIAAIQQVVSRLGNDTSLQILGQ